MCSTARWALAFIALLSTATALSLPCSAFAQDEPVADGDAASDETAEAEATEPEASPSEAEAVAVEEEAEEEAAPREEAAPATDDAAELRAYAAQLRQRQEIGSIHRAFGIATWASMLVTAILGTFQFHNLYGGFGSREDTPCVQGNAVFGQEQCWGIPWPHRIAALTTTALYATTFTLSLSLPDPDNLSEGRGAFAERLNIHKALRWAHLVGMVAQIFLGFATAQNWFGIDRANDFETQRILASVHQGIGWATLGLVTAAGAIMIF